MFSVVSLLPFLHTAYRGWQLCVFHTAYGGYHVAPVGSFANGVLGYSVALFVKQGNGPRDVVHHRVEGLKRTFYLNPSLRGLFHPL